MNSEGFKMKKIILIAFILLPSLCFGFGKEYTIVDIMKINDDLFGNQTPETIGKRVCLKEEINIETYPISNSNYINVIVSCPPYKEPLSIYSMEEKDAIEFIIKVKGKFDCLRKSGYRDCD
jgi:hypothetical protein